MHPLLMSHLKQQCLSGREEDQRKLVEMFGNDLTVQISEGCRFNGNGMETSFIIADRSDIRL